MTKPIEDSTNAAAIRTALDVPTTADLTAVDDAAQAAADAAASKYTKPGTGIPASDLAATVQTSLGKADSAIQDLAGMTAKFSAGTAPEKAAFQASVSEGLMPVMLEERSGIGAAKLAAFGCSVSNGSNSTNAGTTSYGPQVKAISDHMQISEVIRLGYPGQSSSYVASQLPALLAIKPTHVLIGPDFGTNSAALTVSQGIYTAYGQYIEQVVKTCRSAGIVVYACRTLPRGIEQDQYSGTAAAAGSTSTIILPATADAVTYLVGSQIVLNGDGVVRAIRSYDAVTRNASFTPVAAAATSTSTAFVISGAGDVHRGTGLQNLWLTQNAGRLGLEIIDTHSTMCDSRGFLSSAYYLSADPVHPTDAGHLQLATVIAARLATLLPRMQHPATAYGGLGYSPLIQGPATGSLPAGMSAISPTTMVGTKTYSIGAGPLGDAPGNVFTAVFDTTASGGGTFRIGYAPNAPVTAGDKLFVCGTLETSGTGTVSLQAWNASASAAIATIGTLTNTAAAKTFAAVVTVPAGCSSASVAYQATTTTGNILTVKEAGLAWWNLTSLGLV